MSGMAADVRGRAFAAVSHHGTLNIVPGFEITVTASRPAPFVASLHQPFPLGTNSPSLRPAAGPDRDQTGAGRTRPELHQADHSCRGESNPAGACRLPVSRTERSSAGLCWAPGLPILAVSGPGTTRSLRRAPADNRVLLPPQPVPDGRHLPLVAPARPQNRATYLPDRRRTGRARSAVPPCRRPPSRSRMPTDRAFRRGA